MIIAQILGVDQTAVWLGGRNKAVIEVLRTGVRDLAKDLSTRVKEGKLSGEVLHVKSGRLRRSITYNVTEEGTLISGLVGTNVRYAAIHEFGGVIERHRNEHMQRFRLNRNGTLMRQSQIGMGPHLRSTSNLAVFAKASHKNVVEMKVKGGDWTIHMPERSFLRTALNEMAPRIRAQLQAAVLGAIK